MNKIIAIIAGEPNSISSEIIFKSWKLRKKFIHKPFFIIGSIKLLNLQNKKLNCKIKIKEINFNFKKNDLYGNALPVLNVDFNQKNAFEKISIKSNKYIFNCFNQAINLFKNKKIIGFINCPVKKETLFKKNHKGVTEFLAKKVMKKSNETMLIFNDKLSVSPLTTHIPLKNVDKNISKLKIIKKTKVIDNFYKKFFNKKPKIAILGLNPHNFSQTNKEKIIKEAIIKLNKLKVKALGPISPDTSFMIYKKYKFDVIVGMYHDQVLTPFKALFSLEAINITLGLPFIRISPDHGVAENIVGKKIANPKSLINSIKFFNNIKT